ncbi:hypothetical protein BpHYR1_026959 [Brachionus plicatilis]|uniref:Uncharacterized protein n=1 Tax=Brachionus plicatilis TaxID=10195 RepID=A0A3M7QHX2_BRAPC|nr:hypothetical protein BpHYR1_026959 [Brachionus plicatilis]
MSPAEVIPLILPKIGCNLLLTFLFFSIAYDRFQWLSMVFIEFAIVSIENRLYSWESMGEFKNCMEINANLIFCWIYLFFAWFNELFKFNDILTLKNG